MRRSIALSRMVAAREDSASASVAFIAVCSSGMQERPSVKKLLAYEKKVIEGFTKTA